MAEAELKREADKFFKEMGMEGIQDDALDYFQKNPNGPSSDWKKSLKVPSTSVNSIRPRRTSSDGTTLVHLKKKYSTGLKIESKANGRTEAAPVIGTTSCIPAPSESRNKKISNTAGPPRTHFGYLGAASSKNSNNSASSTTSASTNYKSSEASTGAEKLTHSTESSKKAEQVMPKRKAHRPAPVAPGATQNAKNSISSDSWKSNSSSSHEGESGVAATDAKPKRPLSPTGYEPSNSSNMRILSSSATAKQPPENSMAEVSGVHSSIQSGDVRLIHSHTTPNITIVDSSSSGKTGMTTSVHGGIFDSSKLSGMKMRSLTKSNDKRMPQRKLSDSDNSHKPRKLSDSDNSHKPRKLSDSDNGYKPRKLSDSDNGYKPRKLSDSDNGYKPRKLSDSDNKPSSIPVPATSGSKVSANSSESKDNIANLPRNPVRNSSLKVINVSSCSRIVHMAQDGGPPKRHNSTRPMSLMAGSSSLQNPTRSFSAKQASESSGSQAACLEKKRQGGVMQANTGDSSSGYDTLSPTSTTSKVSDVQNLTAGSANTKKKEGWYDRLSSPNEITSQKKIEPVYETIEDTHRAVMSPPQSGKEDFPDNIVVIDGEVAKSGFSDSDGNLAPEEAGTKLSMKFKSGINTSTGRDRHPNATQSLKLNSGNKSSVITTRDGFSSAQSLKVKPSSNRSLTINTGSAGDHFNSAHSLKQRPSGPKDSRRSEKEGIKDHIMSNDKEESPLRRYSVGTSAIYTSVNRNKTVSSSSHELTNDRDERPLQRCSTESTFKYHPRKSELSSLKPHKPLSVSLSDTSSESWSSKAHEVSSESDIERNLHSSTIAIVNSPEPVSDKEQNRTSLGESLDATERKAMLEFNWSRQSLDQNVREVANSTVEALSTLMEVLASPTKVASENDANAKSTNDNTTTSSEKKWYQDSDEEVESSSSGFPLSPVSLITSPTSSVTSPQRADLPTSNFVNHREDTHSTKSTRSSSRDALTQSLPPQTSQTGFVGSSMCTQGEPEVDGMVLSRFPSDSRIKRPAPSRPSYPPKSKQKQNSTSHPSGSSLQRDSQSNLPTSSKKKSSDSTSSRKKDRPSNIVTHDYAILEPLPDHDYAILDPEYHEEFFGYCAVCSDPVIGMDNGCQAKGHVYHLKCCICSKCGVPLSGQNFYTQENQLLCEKDFQVTLERCHSCKRNIFDRVLKALSHSYHPECFRCVVCGQSLDGVYYASDTKNRVYCVRDYHKVYAPKCDACFQPIIPQNGRRRSLRVIAMDKNYHIHCYRCEDCRKQLASRTGGGEKCYPLNGHLLCRFCHSQRVQQVNIRRPPQQRQRQLQSISTN